MTTERWRRIAEILDRALEHEGAEREAFLDRACRGDPALRQEVDAYLAADLVTGAFVDTPAFSVHAADPQIGRRVGAFRIIGQAGRGGMGTVYVAEREGEYAQQVALKLVRDGRLSADSLRRFHNERQILAQLEHPYIPRILDGGTTGDGIPYFAMEYVEGEPIHRYCRAYDVPLRRRLELFRQVCEAVHFAHQNLVVHRDLKPGNILVTADGVPKLLDFGIAKLLESAQPDLTSEAGMPMTLRYASPEQVLGRPVSTRSDVYSLGVVLYQLLADRYPYRLTGTSPGEIVRAVCDQEPAPPSTTDGGRVSTGSESKAGDSSRPGRRRRSGRRQLAGDLDAIVAKAMRKEPGERYGSVEQLSEDVRRYLTGLPVLARQGSFAYRAAKLVRRNKLGVAVLALIVGFAVNTTWLWSRAVEERDRAVRAKQRSGRVVAFLEDLLGADDPDEALGREVTVREVLDRGRGRIGEGLEDEPEIHAELLKTMGGVYRDRGLLVEAGELFEQALGLRRRLHDGPHPELVKAINNLGVVLLMQQDLDGAEELLCEALILRRELGDSGSNVVPTMNNLATVFKHRGEYRKAEVLYLEGLRIRMELHGLENPYVASSLYSLGSLQRIRGDAAGARDLLWRALEIRGSLGEKPTELADLESSLGRTLQALGDLDGAEKMLRSALDTRVELLGDGHVNVARTRGYLAAVLLARGDLDAAQSLLDEALATLRRRGSESDVAQAESLLGACLTARGRFSEAEPLVLESYRHLREAQGGRHLHTRQALARVVELYEASGRPEAAAELRAAAESPLPEEDTEPICGGLEL